MLRKLEQEAVLLRTIRHMLEDSFTRDSDIRNNENIARGSLDLEMTSQIHQDLTLLCGQSSANLPVSIGQSIENKSQCLIDNDQ